MILLNLMESGSASRPTALLSCSRTTELFGAMQRHRYAKAAQSEGPPLKRFHYIYSSTIKKKGTQKKASRGEKKWY